MYYLFVSGTSLLTGAFWCSTILTNEFSDVIEALDNASQLYNITKIELSRKDGEFDVV